MTPDQLFEVLRGMLEADCIDYLDAMSVCRDYLPTWSTKKIMYRLVFTPQVYRNVMETDSGSDPF